MVVLTAIIIIIDNRGVTMINRFLTVSLLYQASRDVVSLLRFPPLSSFKQATLSEEGIEEN